MAKARKYALNLEAVKKEDSAKLKGQAKIVFDELSRDNTPRLATVINENTEKCLKTKQDTLRVTLYYIIVFKSKGWIQTSENNTQSEEVTQSQETA
jgi:hypothetical protein